MASRVEVLDQVRKLFLKILALAFCAYQAFVTGSNVLISWGRYTGTTDVVTRSLVENRLGYWILAWITLGLTVVSVALWIVLRAYLSRRPDLRSAIYNELVRQNWLKAFRVAFLSLAVAFLVESIAIFSVQVIDSVFYPGQTLPQIRNFWTSLLPQFYVLIGAISLFGSFLYYDWERNHDATEA